MRTMFLRLLRFLRILPRIDAPEVKTIPAREAPTGPRPILDHPQVDLGKIVGYDHEIVNIKKAVSILNKVLATEMFKKKVEASKFTEIGGMNSFKVYRKFCTQVVVIDVNVFTGNYRQNHIYKTVGYEDEPGVVNINRYFVSTPLEFASNIIHEAIGHSTGFSHYGEKSTSVPYQLNRIFEECVAELGITDNG